MSRCVRDAVNESVYRALPLGGRLQALSACILSWALSVLLRIPRNGVRKRAEPRDSVINETERHFRFEQPVTGQPSCYFTVLDCQQ
jgi:hypothetical protein